MLLHQLLTQIHNITTRNWTLMEVGLSHFNSPQNQRIAQLLPSTIELIHGPNDSFNMLHQAIDKVLNIASQYPIILCYTGDVLTSSQSQCNLALLKSSLKDKGIDIRLVYSPLDALQLAQENPNREVVFFDIGFEKSAATNALAVYHAKELELNNFSIFLFQHLIPPAMAAVLQAPNNRVQAFLVSGDYINTTVHWQYQYIVDRYSTPIIITNNQTIDQLLGIRIAIEQLESGRAQLTNTTQGPIQFQPHNHAHKILQKVFEIKDKVWQGIGVIPQSSWQLRPEYRAFDADSKFLLTDQHPPNPRRYQAAH